MKSFVKNILGYNPCHPNNEGILGSVNGYYRCVEAQGRGTLHCHMLVWLEEALNCEEIRDRVQSSDIDFQRRLIEYLDDTISNEIPAAPVTQQSVLSFIHHPCAIQGLNSQHFVDPKNADQLDQEDLHNLVKNYQSHQHTTTCYKYWKGPPKVKECHFDLGDH